MILLIQVTFKNPDVPDLFFLPGGIKRILPVEETKFLPSVLSKLLSICLIFVIEIKLPVELQTFVSNR